MRLIDVLKGHEHMIENQANVGEMDITGMTCDSRVAGPGFLFAALPGAQQDGRDYISQAVENGAVCVLAPVGTKADVWVIEDENPRLRLAQMAANFYGPQPTHIAAVTGTNGKTSVATFLRQIWHKLDVKAANMGTIGLFGSGFDEPGKLTTPDPVKLHETLRRLHDADVDHVALEASSHGLEQFRLDGVHINAVGFTNISRDHLDYHGTMEDYLSSKIRLFTDVVSENGTAVINADTGAFQNVLNAAKQRGLNVITYGKSGEHIQILHSEICGEGQRLSLMVDGQSFAVTVPLVGAFQVENALCALGLAWALGADVKAATLALADLNGVPGRLQHVGRTNGADVYVDYAHTPDALQSVLHAVRPHTRQKLYVVFGCGGNRDAGKRLEMGRIAAALADFVIVTDDNPRHESATEIRDQIRQSAPTSLDIGDRKKAIKTAVNMLTAGDVLVVAGKGHEQGQIVGETIHPFDDVVEAKAAIVSASQGPLPGELKA